jgi:hypothetical protein
LIRVYGICFYKAGSNLIRHSFLLALAICLM